MAFELDDLPYAYDGLSPYMSSETLEFHHDKHHATYVANGNKLIEGTEFAGKSVEEIIKSAYGNNQAVLNNIGQHFNHDMFWKCMKPSGGGAIPGNLESKIISDLGEVEKFKEDFIQAGMTQFGSGWCWLALKDGKLTITKTANADSPLTDGAIPLLVCDVWEHAYYIDYRNRRPDFLRAFIENMVNWEYVAERFEAAS